MGVGGGASLKAAIFAALVLGASPVSASYRPTPKQEDEIKKHIFRGQSAAKALRENAEILAARDLKRRLEVEMGLDVDASGFVSRAPTEAELDRLNGFWRDRRGEYARASKIVGDAVRARDYNLNRAAELAKEYFKINTPSRSSGVVNFNADPPELGSHWQWRLRFDGGPPPDKTHATGAWISPNDGAVNLREEAFSSPAMLAFAIVHEALHYHIKLADSEYRLLHREEEALVNVRALFYVSDLGLKPQEVRSILLATAQQHIMALDDRRRMAQGQVPKTPHGGFNLELTPSGLADTQRAVDADLASIDRSLARGVTDEEVEALKAGAQSEFVRDLDRNGLIDLIIAWSSARENDAAQPGRDARLRQEQAEEAARVRGNAIVEAAAACGFQMTSAGEFYTNGTPPFRILHEGDIDKAKAAFLLVDACQREGHREAAPCNDAVGIIFARWNEPKFKNSMMKWRTTDPFMDGESALGQCLLELRDSWKPRGSSADLKATIEQNYAHRNAARPTPKPPRPPREPREPRNPAPPRGGDRGCYWTNDDREICP
jgi:hypothetical protein